MSFVTNPGKSKVIPAKLMEYLGFIIDSEKMVAYLFMENDIIPTKPKLIREFVSFIGTVTSSFPGNQFGPLKPFRTL